MSEKREDCTTCEQGQPMLGVIYCNKEGRVKTNTTKKCESYNPKCPES